MPTSKLVLLVCAATGIAFGGSGPRAAIAVVPPGPTAGAELSDDSELTQLASHWRWETRCFDRKKRVCPPPCPGGPRVCRPRRCWYETVHSCRPVRVKIPH